MVAFFCSMYDIVICFLYFNNLIYLFKLRRLLHDRIEPTVEKLRKKPQTLNIKRAQRCKTTTSVPPIGAPNWCLTEEALRRFNRSTKNVPIYDYDTDTDDDNDSYHNNTENESRGNKKRKIKKKSKKQKKVKRHKK